MPNYDYICEKCDNAISRVVQFKDRCGAQRCPECSGRALYQFPVGAVRGIQFFEAQYCEPLGVDVTSESDMISKAKKLGYIPAGDKTRGGRNEHKILAPTLKSRGLTIDDAIRARDVKQEQKESWKSFAQTGNTETPVKETSNLKKAISVRHLTAPNR